MQIKNSMEKLSDTEGNFSVEEFKLKNRRHFKNKNSCLCHPQKIYHFDNKSELKVLAIKI